MFGLSHVSSPGAESQKIHIPKELPASNYGPPLPLDIQHHRLLGSKPWSPPRTMNILGRDVEILGKNQPGAWELTFFVFGLSMAVVFARLVSRLHSRQFGIDDALILVSWVSDYKCAQRRTFLSPFLNGPYLDLQRIMHVCILC
jgi:hypothetical protein